MKEECSDGNSDAGTFSRNLAIDAAIRAMLPKFSLSSQRRMCRRILDARRALDRHGDENADAGARHIFREFIPAAELNGVGFSFEYEERVDGRTPDWIDRNAGMMLESYTVERGGTTTWTDRVLAAVGSKCTKYRDISEANALRVVIAVYLDFLTGVTLRECEWQCGIFGKLFGENPELTGLLFFTETNVLEGIQRYGFLCICRESSLERQTNWPFRTVTVRSTTQ